MRVKGFDELGKVLKVKPKENKPEKVRKCRKCGAELRSIPGTNVYICEGVDPETNKPYQHKVLSARPAKHIA